MRVALYGKGVLGKKAYDYLKSAEGVSLIGLCEDEAGEGESKVVFADSTFDGSGVRVLSLELLAELFAKDEADAVILATDNAWLSYSVRRLLQKGIYSLCILPCYYEEEIYDIDDSSFEWIEIEKPRLDYIEYHISFHCNLKCKGCSHFSNLIKEPLFGDFDKFSSDIERLRELFWGIGKIRLMGGEPVLNPELPKFIYAARQTFPDADIRVVSNGLMIREDQKQLFKAMRESAVFFDVSMYPPTKGIVDKLYDICNKEGVKLTVTPPIEDFYASMNIDGAANPVESFNNCPARHCIYLCNGKISTCAMPQLINIYNEHFGKDIRCGNEDVINIYEQGLKGIDLIERLKRPMEICRFCERDKRLFNWAVSPEPEWNEWMANI